MLFKTKGVLLFISYGTKTTLKSCFGRSNDEVVPLVNVILLLAPLYN